MSMHPTRNLFKEFPNRVYVETGAWLGDSIQLALDAGFDEVHSIELDYEKVEHCRARFAGQPVTVYQGDSALILYDKINNIQEPITFWLDSHSQLLDDEPKGDNPFPLIAELAQIHKHPIRNHTIIIDDLLYMTHPDITGWDKYTIMARILLVNPNYKISFHSNPVKNNILVAHV